MERDSRTADHLRVRFASALQQMYRAEVPAYAQLHGLVLECNEAVLRENGDSLAEDSVALARLSAPRHGAIRVGTGTELAWLGRLFALLGMQPVDFYDLVPAGLPVMSTAFRPVTRAAMAVNPFRMFCSLLRPELIDDVAVRESAVAAIDARDIFSPELKMLIERAEATGGVAESCAEEFLSHALEVFRWSGRACLERPAYEALAAEHRLIADIAAFPGPHINHLTPRTLDIDGLQMAMIERGFSAKAVVEGPPRREVPILLRQTACTAQAEAVIYPTDGQHKTEGRHTARFGEAEQRGVALTETGRALYDACLAKAHRAAQSRSYDDALAEAFAAFPDEQAELIEADLAYFEYERTPGAPVQDLATPRRRAEAVRAGYVMAKPIPYEDFLPVSAAGIFRSNLGDAETETYIQSSSQRDFEAALGRPVSTSQDLYAAEQAASIKLAAREIAA